VKNPEMIDSVAMTTAARVFRGTHDFSAFCSRPKDGSECSSVRTIENFESVQIPGGIRFVVQGRGFLYKQVRHMVGALLAVGEGRLSAKDVENALKGGSEMAERNRHGPKYYTVADARGLTLAHLFLHPPAHVLLRGGEPKPLP